MTNLVWVCDDCGAACATMYESIACCQSDFLPICPDCGTRMVILLDDTESLAAVRAGQAAATCPICKAGGIMELSYETKEQPPS